MYISPDLLLWQALPDGADIVRAFFNTDRTRRVLIYRRKDGTFSYTDQNLIDKLWCGTKNEQTFYTEEDVVANIGGQTQEIFGFVPVMRTLPPRKSSDKKYRLFLLLSALSAAILVCGVVFFVLCLTNIFPKKYFFLVFSLAFSAYFYSLVFLPPQSSVSPYPPISYCLFFPAKRSFFSTERSICPKAGESFLMRKAHGAWPSIGARTDVIRTQRKHCTSRRIRKSWIFHAPMPIGRQRKAPSVFTTGKKVFCATFPVCWKA